MLEFRRPERICIGMKINVVVHEAEEGGFWAEVPATPGCVTQGETMDELMRNLHEAVEGVLRFPVPGNRLRRQCRKIQDT
jgi:predicted RNase H-like HicB family nuclease